MPADISTIVAEIVGRLRVGAIGGQKRRIASYDISGIHPLVVGTVSRALVDMGLLIFIAVDGGEEPKSAVLYVAMRRPKSGGSRPPSGPAFGQAMTVDVCLDA